MMQKINQEGLALIKSFEKLRLYAYDDATGKPVPVGGRAKKVLTIGWGHTKDVKPGQTCTKEEADAWLTEDVASAEQEVNRLITVPLTSNQFSALVCFQYNTGRLAISTMLKLINQSQYRTAADEFRRWIKDENPVTKKLEIKPGLVTRREAERALFLKPETL